MNSEEKNQYWQQHIDTWRQSGKPQRVFCAEHQLSYSTFSYWRTKLNRQRNTDSKWLPVQVTHNAPHTIAVIVPGGLRLEVPPQILLDVLPIIYRSLAEHR